MQEYMQLLVDLPQHLFPLLIYITPKTMPQIDF